MKNLKKNLLFVSKKIIVAGFIGLAADIATKDIRERVAKLTKKFSNGK